MTGIIAVPVHFLRMWKAVVRATLAGTAAALAVPTIIFAIALFKNVGDPETIRLTLAVGAFTLALMLILVGGSVILIGIPFSIVLRKAGRESQGAYALFGALSGLLATFLISLIHHHTGPTDAGVVLAVVAFFGVFGAASGAFTGIVLGRSLKR